MIQFYNTLTRKKEEFKPIRSGFVGMYTCGPTTYDYAHIGNLRAMVFYDLVKRYLRYKGFRVKHVMNITDVDDKIIRAANKENKFLKDLSGFYLNKFLEDLNKMNISRPDLMPKATEHIEDMIEMINTLMEKGYAYEKNGSVYFKISKFKDYGKLALLKKDQLKKNAAGRLDDNYDKDNIRDFALWKAWVEDDGEILWETDIGRGRPGWHIECSVMSTKYLGKTFDMHLGGVDLIFPHHTNEIAQAEASTGKKFANYWLHNEHLIVDGKKMSKSLGNFYTLRDLEKEHDPLALRYLFLSAHYRTKLNFTTKALKGAEESVKRFHTFVEFARSREPTKGNPEIEKILEKTKESFDRSMDDDLNMPEALSSMFTMIKDINKTVTEDGASESDLKLIMSTINRFDSILGLNLELAESWKPVNKAPKNVKKLIDEREKFRKEKKWKEADDVRNKLADMSILLEDTQNGVRWRRK